MHTSSSYLPVNGWLPGPNDTQNLFLKDSLESAQERKEKEKEGKRKKEKNRMVRGAHTPISFGLPPSY